jgi:protocatechuate 3,4-dioxygenase, alpha subunit
MPRLTPAQTIGPFFHEGLKWAMRAGNSAGQSVRVIGRVLDRDGAAVSDALLEVWCPDWRPAEEGAIVGLQRIASDDDGRFTFFLPRPDAAQVHGNVTLFARGLLRGLFTRVYLPAADATKPVVLPAAVPSGRADTLVGRLLSARSGGYEWNIYLSGPNETVFFDL